MFDNKKMLTSFIIMHLLLITGCVKKYELADDYMIKESRYPLVSIDDGYAYTPYYVKQAMPVSDSKGRVQIKGSKYYPGAKIYNSFSGGLVDEIDLSVSNDFYVTFYETNLKYIDVEFVKSEVNYNGYYGGYVSKMPRQPKIDNIEVFNNNISPDKFSILVYGCFQPFTTDEKSILMSEVDPGVNGTNNRIRKALLSVAMNDDFRYEQCVRNYSNPTEIDNDICINSKGKLSSKPLAIIGTGDQVYMDAAYDTYTDYDVYQYENGNVNDFSSCWYDELDCDVNTIENKHPLTAWTVDIYPEIRFDSIDKFIDHINNAYIASNSFNEMNELFRKLPVISVIDDHEVRDGYGSQGDANHKDIKPFTDKAVLAFKEHQYKNGNISRVSGTERSMYQISNIAHVPIFMFDLRSQRKTYGGHRAGDAILSGQRKAFEVWLSDVEDGSTIIIVSSLPVFYSHTTRIVGSVSGIEPELDDDIRDVFLESDYQWLVSLLIEARKRSVKPLILSGDIHQARQIQVWYTDVNNDAISSDENEYKVLAYEMISSGLANEKFLSGLTKKASTINDGVTYYDNISYVNTNDDLYLVRPENRLVKYTSNFGLIDFDGDDVKISSFAFSQDSNQKYINQEVLNLEWEQTSVDDEFVRLRPGYEDHYHNSYRLPYIDFRRGIYPNVDN